MAGTLQACLPVRSLAVGDCIDGRYRLERLIAEGGVGAVFEASHLHSDRRVALKLMLPKHSYDPDLCERLRREILVLDRIRHRNIVELLDAGAVDNGAPYLALELLRGKALNGILAARGRLGVGPTVRIGIDLCEALHAAHQCGVIHRDVKPGNVFLALHATDTEILKLIDFGAAGFVNQADPAVDRKLTGAGGVIGTAEYMAPEQLMGAPDLDERVDVYAVAVTLFECLTGTVPFEGNYARVLLQAMSQDAPSARVLCPDIPAELDAVILRALARDRSGRLRSVRELRDALWATVRDVPETPGLVRDHGEAADAGSRPAVSQVRAVVPAPDQAPLSDLQRRRFVRVPYITPVTIRRSEGTMVYGRSEDISEGGLRVLTAEGWPQSEEVKIRFALPQGSQFLEVPATARWIRFGRGLGAAGFEFVGLPDEPLQRIRAYVASVAAN